MLVSADAPHLAVGGHDLERVTLSQVRPYFLASQPTPPRASDRRRRSRHDAERHGQAVDVRLAIELAERDARLRRGRAALRIDVDTLHPRQVDDQAAVAQRAPADIVSAAANGDQQAVLTREATAAITSASPEQRAISPGRLSMLAFQMRLAES